MESAQIGASICPELQRLEGRLRAKVGGPGAEWAVAWAGFVDAGFAGEVLDDYLPGSTEAQAVERLRSWMGTGRQSRDPDDGTGPLSTALGSHEWARSVVLARQAATEQPVADFRARHLPGGLLTSTAELAAWLGSKPVDVSVTGEPGDDLMQKIRRSVGPGLQWLTLEGEARLTLTTGVAVLVELHVLAQSLARDFRWTAAQAATFVLAGGVPLSPMVRTRTEIERRGWNSRVVLEVHPDTPPREVERLYAEARSRIRPGRARLLSEKVCRDVVIARTAPGGWHRRYREALDGSDRSRYGSVDNYRRSVERAERKLLSSGDGAERLNIADFTDWLEGGAVSSTEPASSPPQPRPGPARAGGRTRRR